MKKTHEALRVKKTRGQKRVVGYQELCAMGREKKKAAEETLKQKIERHAGEKAANEAIPVLISQPLPEELKYDPSQSRIANQIAIKKARALYLLEYPYERIFLETNIPPKIYLKYAQKWCLLKDRVDEKVLTELRTKAIGEKAEDFVRLGLNLGYRYLNRMAKEDVPLSPKDFKLVMDAIQGVHRIKQLETGGATDIAGYEKMSPEELREYLERAQKEILDTTPELLDYLPKKNELH